MRLFSQFAAVATLLLTGCNTMTPPSTVHQPMTARAQTHVDHVVNQGAIYQPDNFKLALYDDRRAFNVGDTITILIQENTTASKKSSGNANRTSDASLTVPLVAGIPQKLLGGLANSQISATTDQSFSGNGAAASNNVFTGNLAVTVIDVYPNGNLLVSGEKQITINQGTEFVRFSGVINPLYISAQNSVSSTRVADARIEYRGNGYINEAQTMGWLSRVFMTVWPF